MLGFLCGTLALKRGLVFKEAGGEGTSGGDCFSFLLTRQEQWFSTWALVC